MIRRISSSLSILIVLFFSVSSAPAEVATIDTIPVTDRISMLVGKGGNIGLFVGPDGTLLIDDQYAPLTEKIIAAIEAVGGDIPKFLINTHYHGDHTGANETFGGRGALIFSHDHVRERLKEGSYIPTFDNRRSPLSPSGLPVITFTEGITFHLNGDTLHVVHVPHAHTDGDSFIHFRETNVIHTGDIFFNGFYPFIDVDHGGSLRGMIAAADRIFTLVDDKTRIIPGHGPLAGKAELASYRRMLTTAYKRLKALKMAGKSVEEAIEAKPLADLDEEWGDGLFKTERWIELVWAGIY